jgi:hypothetical protein
MKKAERIDLILDRFERDFSEKIKKLEPDSLFDEILAEKDREIARLRSLPKNKEILDRLKEMGSVQDSVSYRIAESIRHMLFGNPVTRMIMYLLRKRL